MREKVYTLEALNVAYEAIEQQIKWIESDYRCNPDTTEYEWMKKEKLDDDEELKLKAYRNALRMIEKIA